MLTLRILLRNEELKLEEVDHLIIGKVDPMPPPMPDVLKSFLNEQIWSSCRALEQVHGFSTFTSSLETEYLQWKKWYQDEKAETADLPKAYKDHSKFQRLLLLRAMRPDRLTSALSNFVIEKMGERYIEQSPFNIFEAFEESSKNVPIFFVLFPGVDPTPDVERVAAKFDITANNRRFINISMGQGQEEPAKRAVYDCAKKGYWVML
jgi:dynein heavy chain